MGLHDYLQILVADECDVMFTCRIDGVVVEPSEFTGFYRLRLNSPVPEKFAGFTSSTSQTHFVDPKLFLRHFKDLVSRCDQKSKKAFLSNCHGRFAECVFCVLHFM